MLTKLSHAAKELSVSERFLRQLIIGNRIPFYRLSERTLRVDLNELRDYMRLVAEGKPGPSAKSNRIQTTLELADGPLICAGDERLLRQALWNVLLNAQQAMPDGGKLTIRTEADETQVTIAVADTGTGIAPEDRDRILRPFYSTKATGHGLGLSITQRIIQEHGGSRLPIESAGHKVFGT